MKQSARRSRESFWPKIVLKKWLNISTKATDFNADEEVDSDNDLDDEEAFDDKKHEGHDSERRRLGRLLSSVSTSENIPYRSRRRKSETMRAQYIDPKEIRICVGTWNAGGKLPPDDLEIEKWLHTEEPSDVYVLGLQEIVPLNAGNILGAEDERPVPRWESIIRETLNRIQPVKKKYKCHSDPPSPSRFKPANDIPVLEDELLTESDSDHDEQPVHPQEDLSFQAENDAGDVYGVDSQFTKDPIFPPNTEGLSENLEQHLAKQLERLHQFESRKYEIDLQVVPNQPKVKVTRMLSSSERIGLTWPEQPLNLSGLQISSTSSDSPKYFQSCTSFKSMLGENEQSPDCKQLPELKRQNTILFRRKGSSFVRVISKQLVGIYISVWVRRRIKKNVQNMKISSVGVGVMGYMGNKGSIAISMSIYQTLFCFICSHLSSGEKDANKIRRNADVQDIHRRTIFNTVPGVGLPRTIYDHERIIWLGDLNYRINVSFDKAHELISKKEWSYLAEMDQLKHELKKGHAFDGWTEGVLNFPPTYKYNAKSGMYVNGDTKSGKRTPAWCDRILSFGKGMKLLKYKRSELSLSDHRPVTALYLAEVEVFSPKKLQRALTFTDAEVENCEIIADIQKYG